MSFSSLHIAGALLGQDYQSELHIEVGFETPGLVSPRPLSPNIADSFRRDAKSGRQQRGRARCLSTPLLKDVDRLVGPQLHSIHPEHHLRTKLRKPLRLWARVDNSGCKLHDALGRQRILVVHATVGKFEICSSIDTSSLCLVPLPGVSPSRFIPTSCPFLLPVFTPTWKESFLAGRLPGRSGLESRMPILALKSATKI